MIFDIEKVCMGLKRKNSARILEEINLRDLG
ncbi:hypothetical protein CLV73_2342 [Chryseobacterium geocarposphaerae]|uniref:Uncharacterized protein n=1 Tax=Chryseobacterium geocarposphaerae TaxID=1416776 RepID=A0A2M9CBU9_9FLAO|nr:hypothetical protein CLV73_2342 [Chryseobacterium geocarposphaerae]